MLKIAWDIITGILEKNFHDKLTDGIQDKVMNCYDLAEKEFYKKYGNSYGDCLSSFLTAQQNREIVEKSFNYTENILTYKDFNLESFDGYTNASKEAVIDFINLLREKVFADFELSKLLMEKEHLYEQREIKQDVEEVKNNMVTKDDLDHFMQKFTKFNKNNSDSSSLENNKSISTEMKETLLENNCNVLEQNITRVTNTQGNIKGEIVVKYDDFLIDFKSFQDVINYAYYNQKIIELEPVALKLSYEDKLIKELIYDKNYNGKVAVIKFTSYGEIQFIVETFKDMIEGEKSKSKLEIHPNPNIEKTLKITIENQDYEEILSNITLRVENRKDLKDNNFILKYSNINQDFVNVYISFDITFNLHEIINIDTKIQPMNKKSSIDNLQCLETIKLIQDAENVIIRDDNDNQILFEGQINFNEYHTDILEDIKLVKSILFIEKKLGIKLEIPNKISDKDYDDIVNLVKILKIGKIELNNSNVKSKYKIDSNFDTLEKMKTYRIQFLSNDMYQIFGIDIDLGEQVVVLEKAQFKEIKENEIYFETEKESNKIKIYKNYCADYELDEINER